MNSDYICIIKDIPAQYFFIEALDGTLEDFLHGEINVDILLSSIIQISFALHLLQKKSIKLVLPYLEYDQTGHHQ